MTRRHHFKRLRTGERYGRGCWRGSRIMLVVEGDHIIEATDLNRRRVWRAGVGELVAFAGGMLIAKEIVAGMPVIYR